MTEHIPRRKAMSLAVLPTRDLGLRSDPNSLISARRSTRRLLRSYMFTFSVRSSGELGLGSRRIANKKPIDVKRPRLNDNLSAIKVSAVQVSCGGMHVVALTHDNKILTWGVNDQGALGRDTSWDGGICDMDKSKDSYSDNEDDTGINPKESTPTTVSSEHFAPGTRFVQVVASDSATFALTEDGRSTAGNISIQRRTFKALAAGSNHILALDVKGNVFAWGCGQQNQLGRRIIERHKMSCLSPRGVCLPRGRISKIACGSYHSFALDTDGKVYGWGLITSVRSVSNLTLVRTMLSSSTC
ncbi:regulator of chromosome condensation 1/beta-lactamase-inhibitor protein II [Fusarium oxysporum II5]|nr:regulator of chromosome condensation 1/beta-lactamase-inhibitor protein II [Fusarium oxysporum II5]